MSALRQRANFRGSISYGWPDAADEPIVLLDDAPELGDDDAARLGCIIGERISIDRRPTQATVDVAATRLIAQGGGRLIAVGSGALLDVGKLAFQRASESGAPVALVMVPCGAEPYRAVAQFAVVDAPDGSRPTELDQRFAACDVLVLDDLLRRLPPAVVALAAADTAVHSIESLLSRKATTYSRMLATAALRTVIEASDPAQVVSASFLAVEAFASTRLGLAHAVASPLGTELGVTHDAINAVLGDALVDYWGPRPTAFRYVAEACATTTHDNVKAHLARLRDAAGLPSSLSELGITWTSVSNVLPRAARSSGISVLPETVSPTELEAFAARGWRGATTKEVAVAEPAGTD
jgi:maleylacetate reductase